MAVGASAGGVEALTRVVGKLPADLSAAVFVVLHMREGSVSTLAEILDRSGPLPAAWALAQQAIEPGTIVVAPPDHHLLLEPSNSRLVSGPKVNGCRPAVDVLFRSAARSHRAAVTGVVLTGALDDGTRGLRAIKQWGGTAIVQSDAVHEGMPRSAVENVEVDAFVPLDEIPDRLALLVGTREEAVA